MRRFSTFLLQIIQTDHSIRGKIESEYRVLCLHEQSSASCQLPNVREWEDMMGYGNRELFEQLRSGAGSIWIATNVLF